MKNFTALVCLGFPAVTPPVTPRTGKTKDRAKTYWVAKTPCPPATEALECAILKMDEDIRSVTYTGNPEVDFVAKMIPHHQGVVDMAKVELEYGKDPKIRKLAQSIIRSQNKQIAELHDWLGHQQAETPVNQGRPL
ncbi:DUF305 domain-containing protein [Hyphomicrobium sp. 99]|uniref:CopM family metallochaperone n=1 Tax=Hyphomicrobium sp. 99 TaxID=1163419 RepID=UPI0005F87ECC|nr:DUF305 domain-containing protein [Hyphomicrobium sp. 99]